jgi:PAS domain S-box-containing protein
MRVGELSRRTGIGVSTLRAWERRFGLVRPERSPSGQRLYTEDDVERVKAVGRLVAEGLTLSAAVSRITAAADAGVLPMEESEAFLLQQVVQAADQGIWVSQGGRTRFANRRIAELLGCSIDEVVSRPVFDFVDPAWMDRLRERGQLVREGHRQRYEMGMLRADGTPFLAEVSTTPLRENGGAYRGAVAVVTDVTARAAEQSETRFRTAALDAIAEAVVAAQPDGTIVYANPAAERLFGWRASEIIGQNGLELLPSQGATGDAQRVHARLVARHRQTGELQLTRRDGTQFPAHITGSPILDVKGELVGLIGVMRDDSDRHRLEREVRSQEQQAETVAMLGSRVLGNNAQDRSLIQTEAVEACRRSLGADLAALLDVTVTGNDLVVRIASPRGTESLLIPGGSRSVAGYTALAGKVVLVEDATLDRRFDLPPPPAGREPIAAAIAAPVLGAAGVRGVLVAGFMTPQRFTPSAAHFMQSIANVAGVALQED